MGVYGQIIEPLQRFLGRMSDETAKAVREMWFGPNTWLKPGAYEILPEASE